jgi:ABC-type phosphate transport system substrate-binding protein
MARVIAILLAILLVLGSVPGAWADVVVVVGAQSGIERLSRDDVINIFLGRYRRLASGIAAVPVDQPAASGLRAEFYRKLTDKDLAEINAYWARLFFSGKTSPPLQASTAAEAQHLIAGIPGGIGYVDRSQVDHRLRVVLDLAQ